MARKPNNQNGSNKPQCQICGKLGHIDFHCYYQVNLSYQPQHITTLTFQRQMMTTSMMTTPNTLVDGAWYMV